MRSNINTEILSIAITLFGYCFVNKIIQLIKYNSLDDILILFVERELYTHLECLEFLYF